MPKKYKKSSSRSYDDNPQQSPKISDSKKSSDDSGEEVKNIFARCPKCDLAFEKKKDYNKHINKVYPCIGKKHGNAGKKRSVKVKEIKIKPALEKDQDGKIICKICVTKDKKPRVFSTAGNFQKHLNTQKHKNNETLVKEGFDIISEDYELVDYKIKHLSLFQQYSIFMCDITNNVTPYTKLLDFLIFNSKKPKYNNIKRIKDTFVMLVDGKWVQGQDKDIKHLVSQCRLMLIAVYDRLRFFLSRETSTLAVKYIYDGLQTSEEYKKTLDSVRKHILSKEPGNELTPIGLKIPRKSDDARWKGLSKHFNWDGVSSYIKWMITKKIKFNKNANKILLAIRRYIECNDNSIKGYEGFLNDLKVRLDFIRYRHFQFIAKNVSNKEYSGDEMERYSRSFVNYGKLGFIRHDDHPKNEPYCCYSGGKNVGQRRNNKKVSSSDVSISNDPRRSSEMSTSTNPTERSTESH